MIRFVFEIAGSNAGQSLYASAMAVVQKKRLEGDHAICKGDRVGEKAHWCLEPQRVLFVSGSFCVLLGVIGMVGWHGHSVKLLQGFTDSSLLFYNTAIAFVLCGVGLIGVGYQASRLILLVGSLVFLLGLCTFSEYVFGVDLGLDQLFMTDTLSTSQYPGRMSLPAAVCFIFSGLSLVLCEHQRFSQPEAVYEQSSATSSETPPPFFSQALLLVELLRIFITTYGATTCLLYVVGMMGPHVLGSLSNMAIHTAVGFIFFGLGLWAMARREQQFSFFIDPLAAFITAVFTVALVFQLGLSSLASESLSEVQMNIAQEKHSASIVYTLEQLFSQLKDAETGRRGYLLTGEETYLEPYDTTIATIRTTLSDLELLSKDSRSLRTERFVTLKELTEQKLTELQDTITARQESLERALPMVRSNRGQELMGRIRHFITNVVNRPKVAINWGVR